MARRAWAPDRGSGTDRSFELAGPAPDTQPEGLARAGA